MLTQMKSLLASLSLGRSPDARFNLSAAIGSTMLRQLLSSALYFVALWVTTRQLGPHHNGLLVTALLLPQTLYAVLNLGLASSHVYHMSSGTPDAAAMRRVNWTLAGALWGLALLALGLSSDAMIGRYLPGTSKDTALYASLLFPAMLLAAWTVSLIQGARDYATYNKTALTQPFIFCAGVLVLGALEAISVVSVLSCHILSQAALWLASEARVRHYPAAPPGGAAPGGGRGANGGGGLPAPSGYGCPRPAPWPRASRTGTAPRSTRRPHRDSPTCSPVRTRWPTRTSPASA